MYSLTAQLSARKFISEQLPALGASLLLAEWLYKFHSFTLECLAFLATWYAADACAAWLRKAWSGKYNNSTQTIRG
ncbi:MAG: hypothetical protein ACRD9R_05190 [Pyrinomonadaceae bacterium]